MEPKKLFLNGIKIKNFRGIKYLNTRQFGSINLITGKNNSGKSTLLEAIFLSAGPCNPDLLFQINARRGLVRVSNKQSTINYLHNNLNLDNPISITAKPRNQTSYTISVLVRELDESAISELPAQSSALSESDSLIVELEFHQSGKSKHISKAIVNHKSLRITNTKNIFSDSVFVSSGYKFDHDIQAERYSDLDKANLIPMYERLLGIFEEKIKRTSLVIENDETIIHVDIGFGLMPLPALGSGMSRFSAILLAISKAKNAIVLIDEIENAFYHSSLESMWMSISEIAKEANCQVFAATHSEECIKAAISVFKDKSDSGFRLHRLDRDEEKSNLHTFELEELITLSENGWDLR